MNKAKQNRKTKVVEDIYLNFRVAKPAFAEDDQQ